MSTQVKVPAIGESITEAVIGQWLKHDGDVIELDDVLCEIESEKATIEIVAESSGVLSIRAEEGATVSIGQVIAEIAENGAAAKPSKASKKETTPAAKSMPEGTTVTEERGQPEKRKVSPVAANILNEAGLSAAQISGSGPSGKITKSDALQAAHKISQTKEEGPPAAAPLPAAAGKRAERHEKMSTLRKTISRRLLEAKHGTAMLTTINEIDLSEIKNIRARYKESFKEKYNIGLGFMSFFTRAVTLALQEFPLINASLEGDEIVYHDYCDIGVAVSTDRGLVVPVIRDAQSLSLSEIENEVARLAQRARENKLTIDEMTGGTFSITNGGVFGSLISTPIINTPQSAILGMHTIQERPVARDGQVVIRPMMYVALSYDHRLIDGRESVQFLVRVKEILEDPVRMLLNV